MEDIEDNGLILGLLKTYEDAEPRFADFAIHCTGPKGDEIVWSHKILLVLRSGYFDGLLRMQPETKSISLPDYSSDVVRAVVKSVIAVDEEGASNDFWAYSDRRPWAIRSSALISALLYSKICWRLVSSTRRR